MVTLPDPSELLLDAAERYTADDVAGENEVHNNNRENRERDHHVYLAHIKFEEVRTAQLCNENGERLLVVIMQDQGRREVIVPARHKGENRLYGDRRFHERQHDAVEGVEFAGTVDPCRFHEGNRQHGVHVLFHVEECRRSRD